MTKVNVTISIPDADKFNDVVQKAKQKGLKVSNVFEKLGVATGSIDQKSVSELEDLEGMGSVEAERNYTPSGSKE